MASFRIGDVRNKCFAVDKGNLIKADFKIKNTESENYQL
jgi:hypothetical protein